MSIAEWRRCGLRAKDFQPRIDDDARVMATPGPDVSRQAAEIAKLFRPARRSLRHGVRIPSATPRVVVPGTSQQNCKHARSRCRTLSRGDRHALQSFSAVFAAWREDLPARPALRTGVRRRSYAQPDASRFIEIRRSRTVSRRSCTSNRSTPGTPRRARYRPADRRGSTTCC